MELDATHAAQVTVHKAWQLAEAAFLSDSPAETFSLVAVDANGQLNALVDVEQVHRTSFI